MTSLEMLNVASLVIGVGVPVVSLIYQAGSANQRVRSIEEMVRRIEKNAHDCGVKRDNAEAELHGRVTAVDSRVSRIEGWKNGHGGAA